MSKDCYFLSKVDNASIVELITMFADIWMSLDTYGKGKLITQGQTKRKVALIAENDCVAIFS